MARGAAEGVGWAALHRAIFQFRGGRNGAIGRDHLAFVGHGGGVGPTPQRCFASIRTELDAVIGGDAAWGFFKHRPAGVLVGRWCGICPIAFECDRGSRRHLGRSGTGGEQGEGAGHQEGAQPPGDAQGCGGLDHGEATTQATRHFLPQPAPTRLPRFTSLHPSAAGPSPRFGAFRYTLSPLYAPGRSPRWSR